MGTFGDSLTTTPSYEQPLAATLGYQFIETASGGWTTANLLAALPSVGSQKASRSQILVGVNDILNSVPLATIQSNLLAIANQCPDPRVCTILPFANYSGWTSGKETVREQLNTWIMSTFAHPINAEAMGTGSPPALLPEYDSGDGLHLTNPAGDNALAAIMVAQGGWN